MNYSFTYKNNKIIFFFAFASIATVIFNSNRFWSLYDSSYILEQAYLISVGKIPYLDFAIHTTPGTYIIQSLIIKYIGFTLYSQIIYCCLISVLTYLITYRILFFFSNDKIINFFVNLPIILTGGYGIFSVPFYDTDCVFFILLSLLLILYSFKKSFPRTITFLSGFFAFVPFIFKQNIGLIYFIIIHFLLLVIIFHKNNEFNFKKYFWFISGSLTSIMIFLIYIINTSGLDNSYYYIFGFAYSNRLTDLYDFILQNFSFIILRNTIICLLIILVIKYIKVKNIWIYVLSLSLFITPFYLYPIYEMLSNQLAYQTYFNNFLKILPSIVLFSIIIFAYAYLKLQELPLLIRLIPFAAIGVVIAAFLPHSYWGSHFGVWPIFSILIIFIYLILSKTLFKGNINLLKTIIITNSILITISIFFYIYTNYNFHALEDYSSHNIYHAKTKNLKGLSLPGETIPNMDNFLIFANKEIPLSDPIVIVPHEDPFFIATRRYPYYPLIIHDLVLDMLSVDEIIKKISFYNVKWMVIKTKPQGEVFNGSLTSWKNIIPIISHLKKTFYLYKELPGYEVYRKKDD